MPSPSGIATATPRLNPPFRYGARMKLLPILGSLSEKSRTRLALDVAIGGARKTPLGVTVLDPLLPRLPLFEGDASKNTPESVAFRAQVAQADALLVATPVYHDSYSGVLKNGIDHLYDELRDKVVALIAVGGGRTGQGQALEHLRAVFRETSCWVLPRQVAIASAEKMFDEAGKLLDAELETRLTQLGQELVLRTRQLRPKSVAPPAAAPAAKP